MTSAVVLEDVSLAFPKTGSVLSHINHQFRPGQFTAILGPSGCGKSTLLRVVAGLEKPDEGRLTAPEEGIGFVFQKPALLPWASALKNVQVPSRLGVGDPSQAEALLHKVGLHESLHLKPHELSGGMQMRVAIARALMGSPELLLMDEPFAALDSFTRQKLNDDLLAVWAASSATAVFVTHSVSEAAYLADEVILMSPRPGRIIGYEPVPFERSRDPSLLRDHAFQDFCSHLLGTLEAAMVPAA